MWANVCEAASLERTYETQAHRQRRSTIQMFGRKLRATLYFARTSKASHKKGP